MRNKYARVKQLFMMYLSSPKDHYMYTVAFKGTVV
jgi:hypothetical protein